MHAVLVDAGPLIALLDRSDAHHDEVVKALRKIQDPLVSVWPVLVEAMYLLSFSWQAQKALWEIFETGTVQLLPLGSDDIPPMKTLMEKYRDLPMDLADAALVRVAEREGLRRVLTLDQKDFNVYRLPRKGRFTLLP
ncbi:MAG TPA: PIN domain-containing protein [Thermoanaerobaculia bacterium]|jgi:predicted nucleic acid-binding protein|nr:PIN domain-containing protein [Thermoanaerobaculia bacterium]